MFIPEFLNSLPQTPRNNPRPIDPTNKNFKTRIHYQYDYLLGFQMSKKVNDSPLEKRWPRNNTEAKDDSYQTFALSYNREMD
jgi:hypothetical protein